MPPTFGQPPIPLTQPRMGTLHFATGPLQPSLTRQRGSSPYSVAKLPCSVNPARLHDSRVVRPKSQVGRSRSSSSGAGAIPATCIARWRRISVMLSGWAGQPGMQTIGQVQARAPVPAEVVGNPHGAGRVVLHRRDAAVGRAGADCDDPRGVRSQPIDPVVGGDRLVVDRVGPEAAPVPVPAEGLVADRALDHQHEVAELVLLRRSPGLQKIVARGIGEDGVVQDHPRHTGDRLSDEVLEAGARRRGHGHGLAVTAKASRQPEDVNGPGFALTLPRSEFHRAGVLSFLGGSQPESFPPDDSLLRSISQGVGPLERPAGTETFRPRRPGGGEIGRFA